MCGIAGIIHFNMKTSKEELDTMRSLLAHRGADGHGFYLYENVGLVHNRLSIIDLEQGRQPMCALDDNLALVTNGEIYNFKELREQLGFRGRRFSTNSDCEVLLHAYLEYGDRFIEKIAGMFAFALWDGTRRRLILARDRLGIKPLYYYSDAKRFLFASEMKALLPFIHPDIDPQAMVESLQNQFSSGEKTLIRGVQRVLPGEMITVDPDIGINRKNYWSLSSVRPCGLDYEEAEQEFSLLFETVMLQHMRSDVPYGLFLSGGVDSAIILSMLHRLQSSQITTFSLGFSDTDMTNELEDAQRMADHFQTMHIPIMLGKAEALGRIPYMIWATDEFMWDYACLPTSFLAQAAREHSLKVVFTGEGGDEVFAGYGRYRKTWAERAAVKCLHPCSGGFRTRGRWRRPWPKRIFGPELDRHASAYRDGFERAWRSAPKRWDYVRKAQYTDLLTELPNDLNVKVDRMLMAFGVEGRVPFLDHRVVQFGLSLPPHIKVMHHHGKVFLKKWAQVSIPKDHLWKKKRGFSVPVGDWLRGDFLTALEYRLCANRAVRTWFNISGVRKLFARQKARGDVGREIWGIMHFAVWHRLFIDAPLIRPALYEDILDVISC